MGLLPLRRSPSSTGDYSVVAQLVPQPWSHSMDRSPHFLYFCHSCGAIIVSASNFRPLASPHRPGILASRMSPTFTDQIWATCAIDGASYFRIFLLLQGEAIFSPPNGPAIELVAPQMLWAPFATEGPFGFSPGVVGRGSSPARIWSGGLSRTALSSDRCEAAWTHPLVASPNGWNRTRTNSKLCLERSRAKSGSRSGSYGDGFPLSRTGHDASLARERAADRSTRSMRRPSSPSGSVNSSK